MGVEKLGNENQGIMSDSRRGNQTFRLYVYSGGDSIMRTKETERKTRMSENVNTEFKETGRNDGRLPGSITKEVVSFANTEGGDLYIGIRDDGTIAGTEDPDETMRQVSSVLHDTILPDIMPFVQIRTEEKEGRQVVRITVNPGTERPYYLAREGLRPKGVYVRRGSACIPLSENGIREMIAETAGRSFENSRSLKQALTFATLQKAMAERNLEFGLAQMRTLGLTGSDGLYTNLGLLLSDQCEHTIKAAVFQGNDGTVFRTRREFTGSLLKQLDEAYQFLDFCNRTEAVIEGLVRTDRRDYPEDALREALLNSIIHRDYLFSGSTLINLYDDHAEFISLGSLVKGISMDAVFLGASQSRNPGLAAVFYRLGLVESYGTGIRKIMSLYRDCAEKPLFRTAEGVFSVTLPGMNSTPAGNKQADHVSEPFRSYISPEEERQTVCLVAERQGWITRKTVEDVLGCGTTKAYKLLLELCAEGVLVQRKSGKLTVYLPQNKL